MYILERTRAFHARVQVASTNLPRCMRSRTASFLFDDHSFSHGLFSRCPTSTTLSRMSWCLNFRMSGCPYAPMSVGPASPGGYPDSTRAFSGPLGSVLSGFICHGVRGIVFSRICKQFRQVGFSMAPSWVQRDPKFAPSWSKTGQGGSSTRELAPNWPEAGPRWPQAGPSWPQAGPSWPQDGT